MRKVLAAICAITLLSVPAVPAAADGFDTVQSRDHFVKLISGRHMTRFGIKVGVSPSGEISGRAFGYPVTGAWRWDAGYFCRDLYWGSDNLGPNCQMVRVNGNTIRFISDQGRGQSADLTLR